MCFTRSDLARESSYLEGCEKIEAAEPHDRPCQAWHGHQIAEGDAAYYSRGHWFCWAPIQALGESAVFCETGFGQDYVTSEQIMKALETVGHPFRLEDVSELHAISSNEHLNFVVALLVLGPAQTFLNLEQSICFFRCSESSSTYNQTRIWKLLTIESSSRMFVSSTGDTFFRGCDGHQFQNLGPAQLKRVLQPEAVTSFHDVSASR